MVIGGSCIYLKIMAGREGELPHYCEQDVLAMLNRIHPVGFSLNFGYFVFANN